MQIFKTPFFSDPRDYQIAFLGTFLGLGIMTRDWSLRSDIVITIAIACCTTQLWLAKAIEPEKHSLTGLKSALITTLGLSLLLRADSITTGMLAGSLAIGSKFIFKVNDKHWFNPANFGIVTALLLTPDAWVSPGQWGEDWWYLLLFAGAGGVVLKRVGRWDTSVAFLVGYTLLEAIRNVWLGWTWDVWAHKLMSGSLLLFALFMITDPRSIPNHPLARIGWSIAIAILTFILRNYFFISTAPFFALLILSPLTILLDYYWQSPSFVWQKEEN
jgi:Na+-transporting NADH:ubiquinone oxidoreductase subunit NqrB